MKIGLFTIYKAKNYGTQLQAQAMYNSIKCLYPNAEVKILSEEKEVTLSLLKPFSKNPFTVLKRWHYYNMYKKYESLFIKGTLNEEYDVIVIGSDELWNVKNPDFSHSEFYVGNGFNAKKSIVYAMSCNRTQSSDFSKCYGSTPFKALNSIAVRDEMTRTLVKDFTNEISKRVLDPTFLVDFDTKSIGLKNYILVYGYDFSKEEQKDIRKFAKEKKLKIISIGFEHHWCDKFILCSCEEFVSYINNATYVITSTFHGSVFSIKYGANFASYVRDNPKVDDLLMHFNLSNRDASKKSLNNILCEKIDYTKIKKQISNEIKESIDWLKEKIEEK